MKNVNTHIKAVSDKKIEAAKKKMGAALKAIRKSVIKENGRSISTSEVADRTGVSKATVAQAELGRMSLDTYMKLVGAYRGLEALDILELLAVEDDSKQLEESIFDRITTDMPLSPSQFANAIQVFQNKALRVSYKAFIDLHKEGYYTRVEITDDVPKYYASTKEGVHISEYEDWQKIH